MSCTCPYCNQPAKLVNGGAIYPHRPDLWSLQFWQCPPCDAYVGCHKKGARVNRTQISDGTMPLGRLANAELRMWKSRVHGVFDQLWRDGGMTRSAAYSWLANKMGLHKNDCHVGEFTVEQCKKAHAICSAEEDKKMQASWDARWGKAA